MPRIFTQFALGLWGIAAGNYSSIAPVQDNVYAVVDDKDTIDGYRLLTLEIDTIKGKITNAQMVEPRGMAQRREEGKGKSRDCEGACYFPLHHSVFVSGEADQNILEYDSIGNPTGRRLETPACMRKNRIAMNLGFEALTYNEKQKLFWTTTEGMLPSDGSPLPPSNHTPLEPLRPLHTSATGHQSVVNNTDFNDGKTIIINQSVTEGNNASKPDESPLEKPKPVETAKVTNGIPVIENMLRLVSFNNKMVPFASFVYRMDKPISNGRKGNGVHGVPSMFALDNGKLLVMEREGFCPKRKIGAFVSIKIYVVDLREAHPVSLDTPISEVPEEYVLKKELVAQFKTHLNLVHHNLANYEGLCLGPKLADGRQTLLLIADSQKGMGNFLFHLKDYVAIVKLDKSISLF